MTRVIVPSPTEPKRVLGAPAHASLEIVWLAHETVDPSVQAHTSWESPIPEPSESVTPKEEFSAIVEELRGVTEDTVGASASTVPFVQLDAPRLPSRSDILHSIEKAVSASGSEGIAKAEPETVVQAELPLRHSTLEYPTPEGSSVRLDSVTTVVGEATVVPPTSTVVPVRARPGRVPTVPSIT